MSPRDGVCTGEHAWSCDCLPNGARDPLGVRESCDLPTVTCLPGLGADSWVRNTQWKGVAFLVRLMRGLAIIE